MSPLVNSIKTNLDNLSFESAALKVVTESTGPTAPVFKFFNIDTGTHFYTAAEAEKDSIIANLPSFNFEGTAYWVDPVMG